MQPSFICNQNFLTFIPIPPINSHSFSHPKLSESKNVLDAHITHTPNTPSFFIYQKTYHQKP